MIKYNEELSGRARRREADKLDKVRIKMQKLFYDFQARKFKNDMGK
jgi:hypothetical protein